MTIAKLRNQRSALNNRRGFTALINGKIPMRALPACFVFYAWDLGIDKFYSKERIQ